MGVNLNVQVESKTESFNSQAESLIEDFFGYEFVAGNERSTCDLGGRLHFSSMSRVMSDFAALHGGFIVRHHYNPLWRIPYKIELVGVDMIDISKGYSQSKNTLNGLERSEFGDITYVWLYTNAKKTESKKVPIAELTYYSEVWMSIDQQTAVSKLTSILNRLDMTTQYEIAELEQAIEEAKAGHYIESSAYSELMKIVGEEIDKATRGSSGAGRIQAAKDLVTPILKDMSNLGLKARGLTPVATGDKPIFNTSKRNGIYADMNANSDTKISASQGMSDIGVYSKAADANYSSIKYTLETDQRTADIRFNDISNRVIFGILARLVQVGIQIGRISDRTAYWRNPNEFLKFRYLRQNKIDTEPSKNAMANKTNIELGVKTKGQIVEEATGTKYESFLVKKHEQDLMEIEYEVKLLSARAEAFKKAGIIIPSDQGVTNA